MSAKNTPQEKKIRRLERAIRKGHVPAFLDLRQWVRDHGYADTAGAAKRLIESGRVVSESHPLGMVAVKEEQSHQTITKKVFDPFVPANLRSSIKVTKEVEKN